MDKNGDNDSVSDLERKVSQQIEYYFGDYNLPRDKFLKDRIKEDDGWVTLETIIKFNRLSRLTTDFKVIVEALKKSKTGLMEVSEDESKIRRTPNKPLPEITEQYKNEVKSRSVYIKGFPLDSSLDDIRGWLDSKGKVESVAMRRTLQKSFKGSIFAVFDSVESAKQFVETPNQKYEDTELIVLFRSYRAMIKEIGIPNHTSREDNKRKEHMGLLGLELYSLFCIYSCIRDDYFAKKIDERKQYKVEAKARAKQYKEEKQKQVEEAEMKTLEEMQGCVLKFSGDLEDQTCREDLHEVFAEHCEIKWINFVRGAKEGIILFKSSAEEALQKAREANNGNLQLRNRDVVWEVLEGNVAREELKKIVEAQQEFLNKKKVKGFRGKGKGGKGSQGGQDRRVKFQGKKTKFESEDEEEFEDNGTTGPASPKKRPLEETEQEPASKHIKTENGAGDQE